MSLPVNQILLGDSREVLRTLPDSCVDAVVTDPPAGVEFMHAEWDSPDKFGSTFTFHGYSDGGDRVAAPTQRLSVRNPNCRKCRRHIRGADGCRCEVPDSDEDTSFMQDQRLKQRDAFITYLKEILTECFRILKPGGHALVWSLPRTSHWTATAIEESGFEVRDSILHAKDRTPDVAAFLASLSVEQRELLVRAEQTENAMSQIFGSGFPKSLNISKALDKMAGAERRVIKPGIGYDPDRHTADQFTSISPSNVGINTAAFKARIGEVTEPATPEAKQWDGWGTALKPAYETWWLVRKPVEAKNTVRQVLQTGTGALNIDACRIQTSKSGDFAETLIPATGRWPANLVLSHGPACRPVGTQTDEEPSVYECGASCPIRTLDQQSGVLTSGVGAVRQKPHQTDSMAGSLGGPRGVEEVCYGDEGGASRFFNTFTPDLEAPFVYATKASKSDKNADLEEVGLRNTHPTPKSQALMRHLVRLITPPDGVVMDPFTGSGSTLVAAVSEGFRFIGIEREPEYHAIASQRVHQALVRSRENRAQREAFHTIGELPQE